MLKKSIESIGFKFVTRFPHACSISDYVKNHDRNNTISETVNDSDSDGGNFSESSDSDTCKVDSPFSGSGGGSDSNSSRRRRRRAG
jgi:hypothetical protein